MRRPAAWLALLAAAFASGGPSPALADDGDPPGRVARVDLVEGAAAAQPGGSGEWVADFANRPLTTGDRLWVDANSRAELHIGAAALRLGAGTGLEFLDVGDEVAQLRLSAGSLNVRLRYLSPDETFEVDTPNTAITFVQPGEYRIDVGDAGDAVAVSVRQGQAEVAGESQSFTLLAPQQGQFRGTSLLGVEFGDLPPPDALEQWAFARDQREDAALSANFLSRDITGYEDLDGYGDWQADPQLGAIWEPQVDVGWAPYSQGYWAWIAPWGWTWIDAAPWGFAPFHYGRWVHRGARWGWCPGQLSVRPVYAPALVVWSSGAGGQVAWFPLGYNEVYRPSHRASKGYLQRVNVTNTYLNNTVPIDTRAAAAPSHYANQAVPGATLVVSRDTFTSARPVSRAAQAPPGTELATTVTNPVPATARSLHPAPRGGRPVVAPPPMVFSRAAVARSAPPVRAGQPAQAAAPRVIVTTVPRAEALHRNYTAPAVPAPAPRPPGTATPAAVTPPRGAAAPSPPPRPAAGNEPGVGASPPQVYRPDRPAMMPHPANDRVLTPPAAVGRELRESEPRGERAPGRVPERVPERAPLERPVQAIPPPPPPPPPPRPTAPQPEPARHLPDKPPEKRDH
jgi:hypothetical protein